MNFNLQEYEKIEPFIKEMELPLIEITRKTGISIKKVNFYFEAYLNSVKQKNKEKKQIVLFNY